MVPNADVAVAPLARDATPLALAAITTEDWEEDAMAFIQTRDAETAALDLTIAAREPVTAFDKSTLLKFVEEVIFARETNAEPGTIESASLLSNGSH
jgi:hypothetical protein